MLLNLPINYFILKELICQDKYKKIEFFAFNTMLSIMALKDFPAAKRLPKTGLNLVITGLRV